MAHFLPPELVRQVNKLEWPKTCIKQTFLTKKIFFTDLPTLFLFQIVTGNKQYFFLGLLNQNIHNLLSSETERYFLLNTHTVNSEKIALV